MRSPSTLVVFAIFAMASPARAQTKNECVQAFAEAQSLRNELKLRASLDRFTACARDECPAPVRADCAAGLEQVTRDLPTVTLGARDQAGRDIVGARIFVDGAPLPADERGGSVPLDPGPHVFRFEHPDHVTAEEQVLIRVGERNRALVVILKRPDEASSTAPTLPATPASEMPPAIAPVPADQGDNRRTVAYVIGGAGLVALSVGAGFGIAAAAQCGGFLREPCDAVASAPIEERNETRRTIRTQTWIANVGFGLGIAAVGTAAVLLLWPSRSSAGSVVRAVPVARAGGGGVELLGSF